MDDKLKRNIRTALIFMLTAALLPCLSFISFASDLPVAYMLVDLMILLYLIAVIAAIVSGSRVIWQLPLKPLFRQLIFALWLILYLALCWAWCFVLFLLCMMIHGSH